MPAIASQPTVRCPFCYKKEGLLLSKVQKDGDVLKTFHCPPCKRTWEAAAAPFFVEVPRGFGLPKD